MLVLASCVLYRRISFSRQFCRRQSMQYDETDLPEADTCRGFSPHRAHSEYFFSSAMHPAYVQQGHRIQGTECTSALLVPPDNRDSDKGNDEHDDAETD